MQKNLRKKIIAVDIDGVLCKEECFSEKEVRNATPRRDMINRINELSDSGSFICIYTARRDKLIPASLEWLRKNGVKFDAFSNKKMPADKYIDDKN